MVDLGGFIVYSWYDEYHRLLKELGIHEHLQKLPLNAIYYQIDTSGCFCTEHDIPFSKKDTANMKPGRMW